jgi:hypothetical protein
MCNGETRRNFGWQHFIRGRVSIEWGNIINNHISQWKTLNINAEQWCAKLLAINWNHISSMWTVRNQEVKGAAPEEATVIQRNNLIAEMIYLRDQYPEIPYAKT